MPALVAPPAIILVATGNAQTAEMRYDRNGRPVMPVRVNGGGPFYMVVDTAAQSSLLSPALVDRLMLKALDGEMQVAGATGRASTRIYAVDRFASELFDLDHVGLPALPSGQVTQAAGIVGMDLFRTRKLIFDKGNQRVQAADSAPASAGFVALKGNVTDGTMLSVPIVLNGVTVTALVDTGADTTLANAAAMKALGFAPDDARLTDAGQIRGGDGTSMHRVRSATIETLRIGPATLRKVPVTFTTAPVVDGIAADGRPAMILGIDLLNALQAYALDFPRAELQVLVPTAPAGMTRPPAAGRPTG